MHRQKIMLFLALIAVGLLFADAAVAEENNDLRQEITQLRSKVDKLESQRDETLEEEIARFLDKEGAWRSASGASALTPQVLIEARFLMVSQNTIELTGVAFADGTGTADANRSLVDGRIDLDFNMPVNDNIDLFVHTRANAGANGFEHGFEANQRRDVTTLDGSGSPITMSQLVQPYTFSGFTDHIGVDGSQPITERGVRVYEGGFRWSRAVGGGTFNVEAGKLDPRRRFLQNSFADDETTQFINNIFDDTAAVLWLTGGDFREIYGLMAWWNFGSRKNYTMSFGWFNQPGRFWDQGQLFGQFHYQGDVNGRPMNLRLMGFYDGFEHVITPNVFDGTGSLVVPARINSGFGGGGVSFDLLVTDMVGIWVRAAASANKTNPINFDVAFGAQFTGLIPNRDRDVLGIGVGLIQADDQHPAFFFGNAPGPNQTIPEDLELIIELYYRMVAEDRGLQITPHVMIVNDPGGGIDPWRDDLLIILGLRILVPF